MYQCTFFMLSKLGPGGLRVPFFEITWITWDWPEVHDVTTRSMASDRSGALLRGSSPECAPHYGRDRANRTHLYLLRSRQGSSLSNAPIFVGIPSGIELIKSTYICCVTSQNTISQVRLDWYIPHPALFCSSRSKTGPGVGWLSNKGISFCPKIYR